MRMLRHPPYHLVITAMRFHGETMDTMAVKLGMTVQTWNKKVNGEADFSISERKRTRAILPFNGVDIFMTNERDAGGTYEEEEYKLEVKRCN